MADSPQPDPDDCFHCPHGTRPCPVTYQPGAWLAQLPAKPTGAVQGRPHRADEIDASIQQALRKPVRGRGRRPPATWPACRLRWSGHRSLSASWLVPGRPRGLLPATSRWGDDHAVLTSLEARGRVPAG
jgi:hypothetical protein